MATNSHDCQLMAETAHNLGLHLRIGHMLRHSPAMRLAKHWLQSGMVGAPRAVCTFFHYDLPENSRPWTFRQDLAGGGTLLDAGIHCIDAIRFLMGDPVIPSRAITDRPVLENGVERSATCLFTVGGVAGFAQVCSQASYLSRLTVSGSEGSIVVDNFAACWGAAIVRFYDNHAGHLVRQETVDVSTTYFEQIRDFANAIKRSNASISPSLDAAENVRIVEEFYAIARCSLSL
jgi:predicted dehydrogenase